MRVALTGATGFIGSHVARRMVADGCDVHALVRPHGATWRIADVLPRLSVVPCDLLSPTDVDRAIETIVPDHFVHLAWCTGPDTYRTSLDNLRFVGASLHLVRRLADVGCRRLFVAGTCAEYDRVAGAASEDDPTVSRSLYVAAKLGLALTLAQLGPAVGMGIAWGRIFYLYGPFEDRRRLVPLTIRKLLEGQPVELTTADYVRDFSHVEDVAAAIWAVLRSGLVGPVNIGSGEPARVRDVVSTLARVLDRPLELVSRESVDPADPPPSIYADVARLTSTTWVPRYDLERGLRHTAEWWKARPG